MLHDAVHEHFFSRWPDFPPFEVYWEMWAICRALELQYGNHPLLQKNIINAFAGIYSTIPQSFYISKEELTQQANLFERNNGRFNHTLTVPLRDIVDVPKCINSIFANF